MSNRGNEFDVSIWGNPVNSQFSSLTVDSWARITKESSAYLRSIGYNARAKVPQPQLGAAGSGLLFSIIESVSHYVAPIRLIAVFGKIFFDKYNRSALLGTYDNRTSMNISLTYESNVKHWTGQGNPDDAADKLRSMLDASHFLHIYLSEKYPSVVFSLFVGLVFDKGGSSISYDLSQTQVTALNVARFKKTCTQTVFSKNVSKRFYITKRPLVSGIFIKRIDSYGIMDKKTYYLLIPSRLLKDVLVLRRILKYRTKKGIE